MYSIRTYSNENKQVLLHEACKETFQDEQADLVLDETTSNRGTSDKRD